MAPVPPGVPSAGFFLSLLTESFAVRAFLGSLIAAALAAAALRGSLVRTPRARRLVLLAPVLAAAAAAVASILEAETYLPQLWIASSAAASGQVLELLGELRVISDARGVDLLFLGWLAVVTVLLSRRAWGVFATRQLLRRAEPVHRDHALQRMANRLAGAMAAPDVAVRLLPACPGGALAAGVRRPVVAIDPALLESLDRQEIEGLLAHEIAHVARRDALVAVAVGVFSDLTFFLPTVHVVGRWLRREREESADDWASRQTLRPAALASGILKVWESASPRVQSLQVCGAVPSAIALSRLRLPGRSAGMSVGARTVATRVERLVAQGPQRSPARQAAEVSIAAAVIVAASITALVVPQWIADELHTYSFAFGYVPPPVEPAESPAFATFRALAPGAVTATAPRGYERSFASSSPTRDIDGVSPCPCVETQAQWRNGKGAVVPRQRAAMAWRRTQNPTWDVAPAAGSVKARPLLTLPEARPQLGFFVVAQDQP